MRRQTFVEAKRKSNLRKRQNKLQSATETINDINRCTKTIFSEREKSKEMNMKTSKRTKTEETDDVKTKNWRREKGSGNYIRDGRNDKATEDLKDSEERISVQDNDTEE